MTILQSSAADDDETNPPPTWTPTMPTSSGVYIGDGPNTNTSRSAENQADIEEAVPTPAPTPTPSTNVVTSKFLTVTCITNISISLLDQFYSTIT